MRNTTIANILGLALLLGGAQLFTGCIREDLTPCSYPLRLSFEVGQELLLRSTSGHDELPDTVRMFLYDRTSGVLVKESTLSSMELKDGNKYEWLVAPGLYDLVAWAGSPDRYEIMQGETRDGAIVSAATSEDGFSVEQCHSHLYYGRLDSLNITGKYTPHRSVLMEKNSKDVRVVVTGLPVASRDRVRSVIVTNYGGRNFDNEPCSGVTRTYLSRDNSEVGSNDAVRDFTLAGLHDGDDASLLVEVLPAPSDKEALATPGALTIYEGSLTELLGKVPGAIVETDDEFLIEINIYGELVADNIHMDIYVNGWRIIHQDGETIG